jgi:hypothetical protein
MNVGRFMGWTVLLLAWAGTAGAQTAQDAGGQNTDWQRYSWLQPGAAATVSAVPGATATDPFAVLSTGQLWQENAGAVWKQPVAETLSVSCASTTTTLADEPGSADLNNDTTQGQSMGVTFHPAEMLTLNGDVHASSFDAAVPEQSTLTRGTRLSIDTTLPTQSSLTLAFNTDETSPEIPVGVTTTGQTFDAQLKQPLGKLPVTAVLKTHYAETSSGGVLARMPSLEQALVWKPAEATTLEMGLRQQQYQDVPGISNALNEALYADWAQTILPAVTWHSYAEVLNSRGTSAPSVTPNANGSVPTSGPLVTLDTSSPVPTSFSDEAVTFTTGPSFKLDEDLSANVEYSNRFDHSAVTNEGTQEQRVSVSVKGTF